MKYDESKKNASEAERRSFLLQYSTQPKPYIIKMHCGEQEHTSFVIVFIIFPPIFKDRIKQKKGAH